MNSKKQDKRDRRAEERDVAREEKMLLLSMLAMEKEHYERTEFDFHSYEDEELDEPVYLDEEGQPEVWFLFQD